MKLAKRNHYNPCFWTAHWSPSYYAKVLAGSTENLKARDQKVIALSVRSGRIFETKVDNVHFDKNLGEAEITREAAEDFCRRHRPDQYEDFCRKNDCAEYPVYIDLEQLLIAIEGMPPYAVLVEVIRRQNIESAEEKAFLGCFVFLQLLRSHAVMNSMLQWDAELGFEKFESFVMLKWILSDQQFLLKTIAPLVLSQWTLFRTDVDTFPLCDSPVLVRPNSVMVAFSPRLLLEILRPIPALENQLRVRRSIKRGKLAEFRRRTIGNTFREIIFSDRAVLEDWRRTPEFQDRIALMRERKAYNQLVEKRGKRELWSINAWGNK